MTPPQRKTAVRVLYLFAGRKRRSDLREYLIKECKEKDYNLVLDEIDVLRNAKKGDLSSEKRRRYYIHKTATGNYDAVIASPPCGTFSRARARPGGPPILRHRSCPRGFRWLKGRTQVNLQLANTFVDFTASILQEQFKRSVDAMGLFEHPEDLGKVAGVSPGSAWQFRNVRALLKLPGVIWGCLAQSDFGAPWRKPTRLLGRIRDLNGMIHVGDPCFDKNGYYIGPLPMVKGPPSMPIGRDDSGGFKTSPSAAWPGPMCREAARRIIDHFSWAQHKMQESGGGPGIPETPFIEPEPYADMTRLDDVVMKDSDKVIPGDSVDPPTSTSAWPRTRRVFGDQPRWTPTCRR